MWIPNELCQGHSNPKNHLPCLTFYLEVKNCARQSSTDTMLKIQYLRVDDNNIPVVPPVVWTINRKYLLRKQVKSVHRERHMMSSNDINNSQPVIIRDCFIRSCKKNHKILSVTHMRKYVYTPVCKVKLWVGVTSVSVRHKEKCLHFDSVLVQDKNNMCICFILQMKCFVMIVKEKRSCLYIFDALEICEIVMLMNAVSDECNVDIPVWCFVPYNNSFWYQCLFVFGF